VAIIESSVGKFLTNAPKTIRNRDPILRFIGNLLKVKRTDVLSTEEVPSAALTEHSMKERLLRVRGEPAQTKERDETRAHCLIDDDVIPIDQNLFRVEAKGLRHLGGKCIEQEGLQFKCESIPHRGEFLKPNPPPVH
jgi:hypothetical protein